MSGSAGCRTHAARRCKIYGMRVLLIPLLIALGVVLAAIVLATPPKAEGAVDHVAWLPDMKN